MNRQELVAKMAEKAKLEPKQAEKALGAFMNIVSDALVDGDSVTLVGFGTFEVRDRNARTGHNPQTGEAIQIAACKAPAFKAGKALKAAVNK